MEAQGTCLPERCQPFHPAGQYFTLATGLLPKHRPVAVGCQTKICQSLLDPTYFLVWHELGPKNTLTSLYPTPTTTLLQYWGKV